MAPSFSLFTLILKLLPLVTLASAFQLYAYGANLNGASLMYRDNNAYLLNGTTGNSSYANVYFVEDPNNAGVFIANLNQTSTKAAAAEQNLLFYVPANNASSTQVGFTPSEQSNQTTSGFSMFGNTILKTVPTSPTYISNFYVQPVQAGGPVDNIVELIWLSNNTAQRNTAAIPVTLRTIAPSDASSSTPVSS